jgi:hypothetical protein
MPEEEEFKRGGDRIPYRGFGSTGLAEGFGKADIDYFAPGALDLRRSLKDDILEPDAANPKAITAPRIE